MPSISGCVTDRRASIGILISPIRPQATVLTSGFDVTPTDFENFRGLIDTGATSTCVSREVVERFSLVPHSRREVATIMGTTRLPVHHLHIAFETDRDRYGEPVRGFHVLPEPIGAAAMPFNSRYFDVLIGMDILEQCKFELRKSGEFELTFD